MKGGFVAKTIVDEQLSEAVIPRFANLKRREKKNPANFNVAKFNILLYSLFSQFNEETYVYVLCIMCKSFMACLQMTNNSLTVTVKFHYLRCFDLYRRLQVLSAPVLYSHRSKNRRDCVPSDTRGRPPILCDPESILISLLRSIRSRGGVVNSRVVKATALVLVDSNKTPYLREFEPTVTWMKSIYRRCNFTRRAGTTTRPPVPRECLKNANLHFSLTVKR